MVSALERRNEYKLNRGNVNEGGAGTNAANDDADDAHDHDDDDDSADDADDKAKATGSDAHKISPLFCNCKTLAYSSKPISSCCMPAFSIQDFPFCLPLAVHQSTAVVKLPNNTLIENFLDLFLFLFFHNNSLVLYI